MRRLALLALALVLVLLLAAPALADIGRPVWARKCPAEMSVVVTEYPDGTNLVECFLFFERQPSND